MRHLCALLLFLAACTGPTTATKCDSLSGFLAHEKDKGWTFIKLTAPQLKAVVVDVRDHSDQPLSNPERIDEVWIGKHPVNDLIAYIVVLGDHGCINDVVIAADPEDLKNVILGAH